MKWWYNEPLLISAVQCKFEDDDSWTLNEYVAKAGFNTEQLLHLTAKGHMAYYNEEMHGEKLDEYLKQSRKLNIRQIIYYNTHCLTAEIIKEHPDWQQLTRDGSPIPAYSIYALNCVNGGWFDDFAKNIEQLCKHDIDGIFLDGPVMREVGCYCEACQRIFEKRFGKSIYNASRIELQTMRVDSVTEYIKKTNSIVKSINPNILLYLNNSALRPDITGSNSREVEPYVDMLGAEGGFIRADHKTSLWSVSSKAKHLETVSRGKPRVTFLLGNQSSLAYYMHNPVETTILYAQSFANGANVWYGMSGSASQFKDSDGSKASIEFNRFVNEHKDLYQKSCSPATVALMWSQETANNYSSSVEQSDFTAEQASKFKERGDHYTELMSFYDMLAREHIQFDIIDETSVLEDLEKYRLVILPNCACLSDQTADFLKRYVEAGGNLCTTFDTGFYDEQGRFAIKPKLSEVQGIAAAEGLVKYPFNGSAYQRKGSCNWLFKDIKPEILPNPLLSVRCVPDDNADVVSVSLEPMNSVYTALPDKGFPGIIVNRYGKGTSVYFTGNIGVCYADRSHPDFSRMIRNIVSNFALPMVETDCLGSVEMVIRKQEDRYLLHMINLTGEMTRPINRIVPLQNIRIRVQVPDVLSVNAVRGGQVSELETQKDEISFVLSQLNDYEVIVMKVK